MANFYSDTMECIYYSLLDSTIRYDKKVFENMTLLCIWSFMYHKFIPHNDFYKIKLIVTNSLLERLLRQFGVAFPD